MAVTSLRRAQARIPTLYTSTAQGAYPHQAVPLHSPLHPHTATQLSESIEIEFVAA